MYIKKDINGFIDRLTIKQKEILLKHCNTFNIKPEIRAWYNNLEDLCRGHSVMCDYTEKESINMYQSNTHHNFVTFPNGEIIKLNKYF